MFLLAERLPNPPSAPPPPLLLPSEPARGIDREERDRARGRPRPPPTASWSSCRLASSAAEAGGVRLAHPSSRRRTDVLRWRPLVRGPLFAVVVASIPGPNALGAAAKGAATAVSGSGRRFECGVYPAHRLNSRTISSLRSAGVLCRAAVRQARRQREQPEFKETQKRGGCYSSAAPIDGRQSRTFG